MLSSRLLVLAIVLVATCVRPAIAADESTRLLQGVPAGTPLVAHVRNTAALRESWARLPYAKLWAEPEVQAFFAPARDLLSGEEAQEAFAKFESATGMTVGDFFALFEGELVIAVTLPEDGDMAKPHFVFGGALGGNREKFSAALAQAIASDAEEGRVEEEEFQGETLHTAMLTEDDTEEESVTWAIVGDDVWFGTPKAAVQGMIANTKGGLPDPITAAAAFAPVYQRNPDAQYSYFVDLERIMQIVQNVLTAQEAAKQAAAQDEMAEGEDGEMPGGGSMFEQMGLTPAKIIQALGLDALRSLYFVGGDSGSVMSGTLGLTWSEQRGLLRMLAYGEGPAPQPQFVAPGWASVTSGRYKFSEFWEAIKDIARAANPMLEFMLTQQLTAFKEQVGIDIEQDFFGSFGDEFVAAERYHDAGEDGLASGEQLWAVSLQNAEALTNVLNTAFGMAPAVAQQIEQREYLGHTIHAVPLPIPGAGGTRMSSLAYAITPSHLFIDIGGTGMLETALQRLNGEGESFWTQPQVVAALEEMPGGASSFTYQDLKQVMYNVAVQLAQLAAIEPPADASDDDFAIDEDGNPVPPSDGAAEAETPGLRQIIDPSALPSRETLSKYWGDSSGAVYRDADGIRMLFRYKHASE